MTIAIGDIHGCLEPLQRLVQRLPPQEELIFLGDIIDRGPDVRGVVSYLIHLDGLRPCRFLMGNHEEMLLKAVSNLRHTANWLFNGGQETLKSYGLTLPSWEKAQGRGVLLGGHLGFFQEMELYVETPDAIFVHAGVDVTLPDMAAQSRETMLWIRERFYRQGNKWRGKPIYFGHTPTNSMGLKQGMVFKSPPIYGLDTGCVYGGKLTAMNTTTGEIFQEKSEYSYLRSP